jgi:hypothetical protein
MAAWGLIPDNLGHWSHIVRSGGPQVADAPTRLTLDPARDSYRNWHVDGGHRTNGNGTSWASAWNALANINWASISPGDTLYISGGASGRTYNEILTIGTSGAPGAPITITSGLDEGNSGPVVIDAQGERAQCIVVGNHNYVTIQNLTIQNTANDANLTANGAIAGVLIQGIVSYSGMGSGEGRDCRCFDIRNCVARSEGPALILQNCIATTPISTTSQTDALWTSGNDGVLIQHNTLTVANTDPTGHSDCIQSHADYSVTFRSNILAHPNGGLNNHGFIVSDVQPGGSVYFYNNIIVMGSTPGLEAGKPEIAIFREYLTAGYTGTVNIWNNTVYGGLAGYSTYSPAGVMPADEFKNNIIFALPISLAPYVFVSNQSSSPANTDYNDIITISDDMVVYNQGSGVGAVRSTASNASELAYFEVQLGMVVSSETTIIGIGNSSAELTAFTGSSADSLGWSWTNGRIYLCGGYNDSAPVTGAPADIIAFALDFTARKLWVRNLTAGGGWNGNKLNDQNPATGTGGYAFESLAPGPYFILISVGGAGDYIILNTGRSTFVGSTPSGFSAWNAASTLNPADISAPATLAAPVACVSGIGYASWAKWQSLGYDQHGINADPQFVSGSTKDFHLRRNSPAIAAGIVLPTVTTDHADSPRAQDATYDIGAYAAAKS